MPVQHLVDIAVSAFSDAEKSSRPPQDEVARDIM